MSIPHAAEQPAAQPAQSAAPAPAPALTERDSRGFREVAERILASVETVIDGKPEAARLALIALLAEGHVLIEDVPGVGKTALARALAASVDCTVGRIQFTPDLLPADITGVSIYDAAHGEFEFKPGAVFAHILIADEINRASPKTQSALLEAMAERQVTSDGETHPLPHPFTVIATQNPLDMEGTYVLPEAQRDRFMLRISMGYPDAEAEIKMLRQRDTGNPLDGMVHAVTRAELVELIRWAQRVYVSPLVEQYTVALIGATRTHPDLRLGASPRATLQLIRAAKARAALDGRDFVLPDDISELVLPVLAHRVIPARRSAGDHDVHSGSGIGEILGSILRETPVPHSGQGG
ncbi:AAA family ATPase [Mycetocola tolaasinivorans]|uniref:AAA family ATPase n=1 Tax=Mycetocola tolaasinivorans TaxID=76635 RepID=A0A3L7A6H2_9MICO|nr:AAA family ATPase [Mycetocola tolaasinivorans]RLP75909.1 AAA family ATPase [Mycetocola tolaasinivorans]